MRIPLKDKRLYKQLYRVALAIVVGIGTGFGTVAFRKLIDFFQYCFFNQGERALFFMSHYYIIILPALGGLLVGPLIYYSARETRGPGVGEVIASVAVRGGYIRPRVIPVKILATALCIGSGGSAGRVGPIVHIGAAIGSALGQVFKVSTRKMRALVACGAAGGIAATFNAPIGGVVFALEVILGDFTGSHLMMVIISSVTSAVIGIIYYGNNPAFVVPSYSPGHLAELLLYVLLGAACGIFSAIYIRVFHKMEDYFNVIKIIPNYFKPAVAGLAVGGIGFFFPQVFGVGFESIESAISGQIVLSTAAMLVFLKLLATSLTIGSGSSGGVFTPGLFMGSMLGAAMGQVFHLLMPGVVASPAAYALVGMGGIIAGSAHAPITAIVMLFELNNDYRLILPIMVVSVISSAVARLVYPHNIYTARLARRGLDVEAARRPDILKNVLVKDVMTFPVETLPAGLTCEQAWKLVHDSPHRGFPVVENNGAIAGIITREELKNSMAAKKNDKIDLIAADRTLVTVTPYQSISEAVKKMIDHDIGRLPVVEDVNRVTLHGMLSRTDVLNAYARGLIQGDDLEERLFISESRSR